jgi:hypothetical protein
MLSRTEKQILISRFPMQRKLSYDVILHKKVYADLYMIQPKGSRAYAWFTYLGDKNVCVLLDLTKHGKIKDLNVYPVCFSCELSCMSGTLILGTRFNHNGNNFFSCEDIIIYQGSYMESSLFQKKIAIMKEIFDNYILQRSYSNRFVIFGLPCWCPTYSVAMQTKNILPYSVYGIKAINTRNYKNPVCGVYQIKEKVNVEGVFRVKATIQSDIYHLYCFDRGKISFYGNAAVPSYARSVVLNKIFRNVKENSNLDLLEESDDEEEFENVDEDKFVDLRKCVAMKCVYHKNFRKWEPIEIVEPNTKLITHGMAIQEEKKV